MNTQNIGVTAVHNQEQIDPLVVQAVFSQPIQIQILRSLRLNPGQTYSDLSKSINKAESTLTKHLKALLELGVIQPEDPTKPRDRTYIVSDSYLEAAFSCFAFSLNSHFSPESWVSEHSISVASMIVIKAAESKNAKLISTWFEEEIIGSSRTRKVIPSISNVGKALLHKDAIKILMFINGRSDTTIKDLLPLHLNAIRLREILATLERLNVVVARRGEGALSNTYYYNTDYSMLDLYLVTLREYLTGATLKKDADFLLRLVVSKATQKKLNEFETASDLEAVFLSKLSTVLI